MVQYSFTSMETRRLVRTDSPGTATSTLTQLLNYDTDAESILGIISVTKTVFFTAVFSTVLCGLFVLVSSAQACEVCGSTDLFDDSFFTFPQTFPRNTFIMLQ